MDEGALLTLLHLCDSLFPTGGFGHSDGLETATDHGDIGSAAQLGEWMDTLVEETLGRTDGPSCLASYRAYVDGRLDDLCVADEESLAIRPAAASREALGAMGRQLIKTWCAIRPQSAPEVVLRLMGEQRLVPALPVAFAVACASSRVDARSALAGFAYLRLSASASAAMRLMAIGQREAHALVAVRLERIPAVVDAIMSRAARVESFVPALDVAQMAHAYVGSRLFRT